MPQRVPAHIAVISGIGQLAYAYAIEDYPYNAFEMCHTYTDFTSLAAICRA